MSAVDLAFSERTDAPRYNYQYALSNNVDNLLDMASNQITESGPMNLSQDDINRKGHMSQNYKYVIDATANPYILFKNGVPMISKNDILYNNTASVTLDDEINASKRILFIMMILLLTGHL